MDIEKVGLEWHQGIYAIADSSAVDIGRSRIQSTGRRNQVATSNRASKTHILVVDSDPANVKLLKFLFEDEGYAVTAANCAGEALEFLAFQHYDLVTLETDLPGTDGLELCRRVRAGCSIPIIFIACRGAVEDKIAGLRAGADDYISKPFEPNEVLARIWAMLRRARQTPEAESALQTGDLTLDPFTARVILARTGKMVELTPLEMRLLRYLMTNAGRSLTRDALVVKVWGYKYESTSNQLDVYITDGARFC